MVCWAIGFGKLTLTVCVYIAHICIVICVQYILYFPHLQVQITLFIYPISYWEFLI